MNSNQQQPDHAQLSSSDACPLCGADREHGPSRSRVELHDATESTVGHTETGLCAECWDALYHDVLASAGGANP